MDRLSYGLTRTIITLLVFTGNIAPAQAHQFSEMSAESGISLGITGGRGVAWIDFDNDGRQDLVVANRTFQQPPRLYHNTGPDSSGNYRFQLYLNLTNIESTSYGVAIGDYDGDGYDDIYLANYQIGAFDVPRNTLLQKCMRQQLAAGTLC